MVSECLAEAFIEGVDPHKARIGNIVDASGKRNGLEEIVFDVVRVREDSGALDQSHHGKDLRVQGLAAPSWTILPAAINADTSVILWAGSS